MARTEILRGFGKSLSRKLGGLSRMQKWYGIPTESRTEEGPADELIRKKATGRFTSKFYLRIRLLWEAKRYILLRLSAAAFDIT